jgi:hypothetical protein
MFRSLYLHQERGGYRSAGADYDEEIGIALMCTTRPHNTRFIHVPSAVLVQPSEE